MENAMMDSILEIYPSNSKSWCKNNGFICPCILGKGSEGIVYKVKLNEIDVAVKMTYEDNEEEGELMKKLHHPNIVNVLHGPTHIRDRVCTVLDYCEKSLKDKIEASTTINWPLHKRLDVLIHVAIGMQYLVEKKIYHRDLKPANVLLKGTEEVVKIADFGFHSDGQLYPERKFTANVGTPLYAAPEVMYNTEYNPILTDIYSFGILMWSVLSGLEPYKKELEDQTVDPLELCSKICNDAFRPNPQDVTKVWKTDAMIIVPITMIIVPIIEIMEKCWKQDPFLRYQSFEDVKSQLLTQYEVSVF